MSKRASIPEVPIVSNMIHRDIRDRIKGESMETMNLDEVCKVLKISKGTARNRLSLGLPMPPSFKVGRSRLFMTTEFNVWMIRRANKDIHQSY